MRWVKQSLIYTVFFLLTTLSLTCQAAITLQQKQVPFSLDSFFKPINSNSLISTSANYTFSGAIADSINYIELYLATDNTCSTTCQSNTCNPQTYSTSITSGTDIAYATTTSGGTHYSIPATSVAAFLHAVTPALPSTTAGNHYFVGVYLKAATAGNCSGGYCSAGYDDAGHNVCLQATFDKNGSGSVGDLQRTDDGNILINTPTQYIYVPNSATYNMQRCLLNFDGSIGNCLTAVSSLFSIAPPRGIALATINGIQYAYITTSVTDPDTGEPKGVVYRCDVITGGTGGLTNCVPNNPGFFPDAPWIAPSTITFTTAADGNQYAYVLDNTPQNVHIYQCTLYNSGDFAGSLQRCNTLSISLNDATGLVFTTINNSGTFTQYAYMTDYASGKVYRCSFTHEGAFDVCEETTGTPPRGFWLNPNGIAIATVNGNPYAYISEQLDSSVYQCPITAADGTLSTSCSKATVKNDWQPGSITIGITNEQQYAYVSDGSTVIDRCPINSTTGAFNTCTPTPSAPTGWNVSGNVILPIITQ